MPTNPKRGASMIFDSYMRYVMEAQTEEEEQIFEIREWYEGRQFPNGIGKRERYVAPILRDMLETYPMLNLVERTVRIINERVRITEVASDDKASNILFKLWWEKNKMASGQSSVYEAALRDRACVVILEWNYRDNHPMFHTNELFDGVGGSCRIHYDENDKVEYVSKRWAQLDEYDRPNGNTRFTLYFPEKIERWISEGGGSARMMTTTEVRAELGMSIPNPQPWVDANGDPLGIAAVVFDNVNYASECFGVMSAQAGMNEAILDWHTSSRYHGIPTVLFEGVAFKVDPLTGREIEPEWGPGKGIAFDSGRVSRLQPVDVASLFEGAVMPWIRVASLQKGWPMHVFTQMPPSGETLRQMESPLIVQAEDKMNAFTDSWKTLFTIASKMHEIVTGERPKGLVTLEWASPVSLNELYVARVAQTNARAEKATFDNGDLSQRQRLIEQGYTPEDADRIIDERNTEKDEELARQIKLETAKIMIQVKADKELAAMEAEKQEELARQQAEEAANRPEPVVVAAPQGANEDRE